MERTFWWVASHQTRTLFSLLAHTMAAGGLWQPGFANSGAPGTMRFTSWSEALGSTTQLAICRVSDYHIRLLRHQRIVKRHHVNPFRVRWASWLLFLRGRFNRQPEGPILQLALGRFTRPPGHNIRRPEYAYCGNNPVSTNLSGRSLIFFTGLLWFGDVGFKGPHNMEVLVITCLPSSTC